MFIPMKSDGQIFVNLRKNKEKKKINKIPSLSVSPSRPFTFSPVHFDCHLFFFMWDPYVLFYSFLVRLSPETNYFVPVFNFIYPN